MNLFNVILVVWFLAVGVLIALYCIGWLATRRGHDLQALKAKHTRLKREVATLEREVLNLEAELAGK